MAILGNNTTPTNGFWFDDTGNREFLSDQNYNMPAGGGVATDMFVYCAGHNAAVTGQLIIWDGTNGAIKWQSGNITLPSGTASIGGQSWVHVTIPNVYLAAQSWLLGFWSSGFVTWTFETTGGVLGKAASSPTTTTGATDEYGGTGHQTLGAYVVYTPGGVAQINTGTPASPVWTPGVAQVNTGTPAAPVWTPANGVYVNTGTPASPVWTPTS